MVGKRAGTPSPGKASAPESSSGSDTAAPVTRAGRTARTGADHAGRTSPAGKAPAAGSATPGSAAPGQAPAKKKAPAKKAPAKRAPAKKAAAGRTTTAPEGAAAKKAPARQKPSAGKAPAAARTPAAGRPPTGESHLAMVRRARRINRELADVYPYAHPELDFRNPFELLVATVLSAQTTDLRVNQTTPALFAKYPTPEDMAAAPPEELEELIRPTGFFRAKAKSLLGLSAGLRDNFGGRVPDRLEDLVTLPGVGRKTANVVLGNAYGVPGITVDTHFGRLVRRWRLTEREEPEKVEAEICAIFPESEWTMLSHRTIFHGRRICHSRKPACGACPIDHLCPSYGEGETDPEKARKLLKYEKGGYPGQRLAPPPDYPGRPAAPLNTAE